MRHTTLQHAHRMAWIGLAGILAFGCAETAPTDVGAPRYAATGCKGGPKRCPVTPDTTPPDTAPAPPDTAPAPDTGAVDFARIVAGIRPRGYGASPYALLTPTGGVAYTVDPAGDDAAPGTAMQPFRTINHAAQVARAGDVVTIRDGTYRESVVVQNGGTRAQPIVFQAEHRGGVVLTGGGYVWMGASWTNGLQNTGAIWITLRGLVFRAYASRTGTATTGTTGSGDAVRAIKGWTVDDCLFDDAGRNALNVRGDSATVIRTTLANTWVTALGVWGPSNGASGPDDPVYVGNRGFRILDSVLRGNNVAASVGQGVPGDGVVKLMGTRDAIVQNVESAGNYGNGVWFDAANVGYTVEDSYLHDNAGPYGRGLHLELSWGPSWVRRNVIAANRYQAVLVANSSGITLVDNLIVGSRGVLFANADRTDTGHPHDFTLHDVKLRRNRFAGWPSGAAVETVNGSFTPRPGDMGITSDSTTFDPGASAWLWYWGGQCTTPADCYAAKGVEQHSTIAPVSW